MATKLKKQKSKQKPEVQVLVAIPETRQALMMLAKDRGIRNFRVLNKMELAEVVTEGVTTERIQEVVAGAVARWKAGWGTKKEGGSS